MNDYLEFLIDFGIGLEDSFHLIDVNGNGEISRNEFADGLIRMRYSGSQRQMLLIFSALDMDKSAEIGMEEYKKLSPYYERRMKKIATDSGVTPGNLEPGQLGRQPSLLLVNPFAPAPAAGSPGDGMGGSGGSGRASPVMGSPSERK